MCWNRGGLTMSRIASFVLILILGLAALTWAASFLVEKTVVEWSRRDLNLRAQAITRAARQSLVSQWSSGSQNLRNLLVDLTQDERLVGAAACGADLSMLANTPEFPSDLNCRGLAAELGDPNTVF